MGLGQIPLSAFKLSAGSRLGTASDGSQVLIVGYGSSASADLGVTPAQLQTNPVRRGFYTLAFTEENYFQNYPAEYEIEIAYGTQKLCEFYGWGSEAFTTVTVVCPSPDYLIIDKSLPGAGPPQGTSDLVINVSNPEGWPVQLKDFSLTFTPTN